MKSCGFPTLLVVCLLSCWNHQQVNAHFLSLPFLPIGEEVSQHETSSSSKDLIVKDSNLVSTPDTDLVEDADSNEISSALSFLNVTSQIKKTKLTKKARKRFRVRANKGSTGKESNEKVRKDHKRGGEKCKPDKKSPKGSSGCVEPEMEAETRKKTVAKKAKRKLQSTAVPVPTQEPSAVPSESFSPTQFTVEVTSTLTADIDGEIEPVPGAEISAIDVSGGSRRALQVGGGVVIATTLTDSAGVWSFEAIPLGEFIFKVTGLPDGFILAEGSDEIEVSVTGPVPGGVISPSVSLVVKEKDSCPWFLFLICLIFNGEDDGPLTPTAAPTIAPTSEDKNSCPWWKFFICWFKDDDDDNTPTMTPTVAPTGVDDEDCPWWKFLIFCIF